MQVIRVDRYYYFIYESLAWFTNVVGRLADGLAGVTLPSRFLHPLATGFSSVGLPGLGSAESRGRSLRGSVVLACIVASKSVATSQAKPWCGFFIFPSAANLTAALTYRVSSIDVPWRVAKQASTTAVSGALIYAPSRPSCESVTSPG